MHHNLFVTLALAGASVFPLVTAQSTTTVAEEQHIDTSLATSFTFTIHSRHTITSSSQTSPTRQAPVEAPSDEDEDDGIFDLITACYPGIPDTGAPRINKQTVDWTAPCWAVQAIDAQCSFGPEALERQQKFLEEGPPDPEDSYVFPEAWDIQPPETVRACLCSSQYLDMLVGCGKCNGYHGIDDLGLLATTNATLIREWGEVYCDVNTTPTESGWSDAWDRVLGVGDHGMRKSMTSSIQTASSTTSSKASANATDVSRYFTASVTGSAAYSIDLPTASSSANQTHSNVWYTYTSLRTSDGQIVPTAGASKTTGESRQGDGDSGADATAIDASTATAAAGAMQTAMVYSVGAIGVAALAFAL